MNYEIKMPSLGADMDQGKLLAWRIHINEKIAKGQTIADVETQKAAVEIESFKQGVVTKIIAKEGEMIPVGQTIAVMEIEEQQQLKSEVAVRPQLTEVSKTDVSLTAVEPKVPEAVTASGTAKLSEARVGSNINIREAIAKAMSKSKKEIPHYYLKTTVDIDELLIWLDQENAKRSLPDRILITAVFVKTLALALDKHPEMNGFYLNDKFIASLNTNINIAISLKDGGVIVPALLQTESKSLAQLNFELKDLIERARDLKLKQKELTDGSITLTILGDLGVEEVTGIIFPPQVALLGIGVVHKEPVVKNQQIKIANVIKLSLAADHRVSDGITGSKFLNTFCKSLAELSRHSLC